MDQQKDTRIALGIWVTRYGYRAYVRGGSKKVTKRFPPATPLANIEAWRQACLTGQSIRLRKEGRRGALRVQLRNLTIELAKANALAERLQRELHDALEHAATHPVTAITPAAGSFLYVIASESLVKLGRSRDPAKRLRTLQIGSDSPLRLVATAPLEQRSFMESFLHRRFAHLRRSGEWFERTEEMERFIDHVANDGDLGDWITGKYRKP